MMSLVRIKLVQCLEDQLLYPKDCMLDEIIDERARRFGLPEFDAAYAGLLWSLDDNASRISDRNVGLRIFEAVKYDTA